MQTRYSKEGIDHYFIIGWDGEWIDNYESRLMRFQEVPMFMPYEIREINGEAELYYHLQYRTSLDTVVQQLTFTVSMVRNMVGSIIDAMQVCSEYLLDSDRILFDIKKVFVDTNTGNLMFCYYPKTQEKIYSLKNFLTELLKYVDRKNEGSMIFLMSFYHLITEPDCTLEKMQDFYRDNNSEIMNDNNMKNDIIDTKTHEVNQKNGVRQIFGRIVVILMVCVALVDVLLLVGLIFNVLTYEKMGILFIGMVVLIGLTILNMVIDDRDCPDKIMENYNSNNSEKKMKKQNRKIMGMDNYDDSMFNNNIAYNNIARDMEEHRSYYGETDMLLTQGEEKYQPVVDIEHGELFLEALEKERYAPIYIERESVVIGCMSEGCDYILSGKGVSRFHAKILRSGERIILLDLNSTNGTYLNGMRLEAGEEYILKAGDRVFFAGIGFFVAEDMTGLIESRAC